MRAIILAAGEGYRLRPLTTYMPKVMLPVGNRPIMEYVIDALRDNEVKDITVVVGYMADKIKQYFGNGADFGVHISYVEQKKQVGTAHALYQARTDEEFILLYGDNMIERECVYELLNSEVNTIIGAYSTKPSRYGVIEVRGRKLVKIREKPPINEESIVFTGMGHFDGEIFKVIEEKMKEEVYKLPDVLNTMDIKLKVLDCDWRDAVFPWDLLELNSYSLRGNIRKLAGKIEESTIIGNVEIGENTKIGAGTYIRGNVRIGENCEIGPNSVIIGDTSIGEGVRIGALSYVENSIIMNDADIGANVFLKDAIVGREVTIGAKFVTISGKVSKIVEREIVEVEGSVVIGDGASLGSVVVAHPGVVVGSNARVGDLKVLERDVSNWESVR